MDSFRDRSTWALSPQSRVPSSGQTCLAAAVIRRYRAYTPSSVARLCSLYLTTTEGASLSSLAALAPPAAMIPAILPSSSNPNLARGPAVRGLVEILMTSLLGDGVVDACMRLAEGPARLRLRRPCCPR